MPDRPALTAAELVEAASHPVLGDVPTLADLAEALRAVPALPQTGQWWDAYGELVGWLHDHPKFAATSALAEAADE